MLWLKASDKEYEAGVGAMLRPNYRQPAARKRLKELSNCGLL